LCPAYTHVDPKSTKKTNSLTVLFALLGSGCVKAAHKMCELTLFEQHFHTKVFFKAFRFLQFVVVVVFFCKEYWQKSARKMLVKMTTGVIFTAL